MVFCILTPSHLTNATSSSWDTHGEIYLQKCKENGVEPHQHALVNDGEKESTGESGTIESFIKVVPKWTQEELLAHIVQFVIEDDQVFVLSSCTFILLTRSNRLSILSRKNPSVKFSSTNVHQ